MCMCVNTHMCMCKCSKLGNIYGKEHAYHYELCGDEKWEGQKAFQKQVALNHS